MTPPPFPGHPDRSDPGTEPLPRYGAQLAEAAATPAPTPAATPAWQPDDTGPVPVLGRPAPPPVPGARPSAAPADPDALEPVDLPTTEQPIAPPPGRAGRNLKAAIGVGVALAAVLLASLLIWRPAVLLVLTAAVLVATVELVRALRKGRFQPPLVPVLVGSLAMIGLAWSRGATGLVAGFLITVLAVLLWRLADGPAGYLRDASAGVLVALYVPLLAGFAALLLAPEDGAVRVLVFIATVVCSDVGGFAAGVLFGKHAMAPSISPKKSWEGMAGSVAACMLAATPLIALGLDGPWWAGAVFGAAIAATATIGDLGESLIKRDLGIKDMGDLLPGHGGLMDRMDSLLPSAAVAYLLLALFAPV
jgi:phosphatidate cytidylyltransferase